MGKHIITAAWLFGLISLALCLFDPAAAQVDQQRAEAYFKEAAIICQRDGGRLWGISLCGPMVFRERSPRTSLARQGQMLMAALNVRPVANAVEASARYGGTVLRAAEQARAERRRAVVRELRKRFVDGPIRKTLKKLSNSNRSTNFGGLNAKSHRYWWYLHERKGSEVPMRLVQEAPWNRCSGLGWNCLHLE